MLSSASAIRLADSVIGVGSLDEAAVSLLGMIAASPGLLPVVPTRPGKGVAPALHTRLSALPTACRAV
jgi:hypothetical protein